VKSVDHTFEGHADILTLHNEPIGVKTYHQDHVTLYFINHQSDQKYVSSTKDVKPQLLFSRTPAEYKRISSHFDPNRVHPVSNKVKPHNGVDLAGPINTPVWAAADGVISHISTDTSFGNFIMISHPLQATTSYAHLNKFYRHLKVGDEVKAFQTIGFIGSTGLSTGPHLHFEYRINSKAFDPLTVQPLKSSTIPSFEQNFF
jgi:murein DD-endopeptidase MepM/ murein hydrolase activator NlpD